MGKMSSPGFVNFICGKLGIYVKHLVDNLHISGKKLVSFDKEFVFGQNLSRGIDKFQVLMKCKCGGRISLTEWCIIRYESGWGPVHFDISGSWWYD